MCRRTSCVNSDHRCPPVSELGKPHPPLRSAFPKARDAGVMTARSEGELDMMVSDLGDRGYRIVTVMQSFQSNQYVIVFQEWTQ